MELVRKEKLTGAVTKEKYTAKFIRITEGGQSWWYMATQDRLNALRELGYDVIDMRTDDPQGTYACQITIGKENGDKCFTAIGVGSCAMTDSKIDAAGVAMRRAICNSAMLTGELEAAFDKLRELNGATLSPDKGDALIEDAIMRM